ncbi:MAG: hypothetical protein ICV81_08230 [Flavisolibacter sp.]|nr:hypothetical protein [Flavisolibacter sp.]
MKLFIPLFLAVIMLIPVTSYHLLACEDALTINKKKCSKIKGKPVPQKPSPKEDISMEPDYILSGFVFHI